jgi:TonB family protein
MSENILVVEYEPRYTDRVRQALTGQPFSASFAKDGEEALRAINTNAPRLIVLSSVIPKISTAELIRLIRGRKESSGTPILLTVSGYTGKDASGDAARMGASDILPKPYSGSEFLGKVQSILGVRGGNNAPETAWTGAIEPEFTVRPTTVPGTMSAAGEATQQLTSNEIFGDLLEDDKTPSAGARKTMKPSDDLDKMLADTLSGVRQAPKKKDPAVTTASGTTPVPPSPPRPAAPPPPSAVPPPAAAGPAAPQAAKPKPKSDLDKLLNDTLSGIEKTSRIPKVNPADIPGAAARPTAAPAPAAAPRPSYATDRFPVIDKVPVSQPVFPPTPAAAPKEEEVDETDGIRFGQYVLVEKIATGGMAEVWKARMRGVEGFQKIVAIKKILPHLSDNQEFVEMFVDEAKFAAQLNHNNIIHIYDLGKIASSYYIAMEFIDGQDLKTILRRGEERGQPMQVEIALFIASKIAAALDYAHRKRDFDEKEMNLVHRDVSPQNVLVSYDGDIKLCDFGIAKAASKASHTQAGALKGKLQYMSPEQAWGKHIDRRSDIFALGTVLYEMLTGNKLFIGDNEMSILEQVREARVTPPSVVNDEVTPAIDRIVVKALQKDPAGRYQTAGEMAKDIDAVLYSFRPTPTSADLAIHMHRLYSAEPVHSIGSPMHESSGEETVVDHTDLATVAPKAAAAAAAAAYASAPAYAPAAVAEAPAYAPEAPAKKPPIVPIAVAAAILIAAVIGWIVTRPKGPAAAAQTASSATAAPVVAGTTAPASTAPATTSLTPAAPGSQAPVLDQSKVDEEVKKRLAAERARMEQARANQNAPAQTQTTAARPAAPVVPPPVAPAPAPVQQQPAPAPAPVQTPPPAPVQVAETPAPAPAPAAARAREGDLVPAGADGLTPPRVTRRAPASYPPLAKAQRVEGLVIMSVLVSETGKVLDVKVLRGVNKPVGINEAAMECLRRSTFAPGTKDGVRVKSYVTVPVEFKL